MKTWQDVLAKAGFPTEACVLDFETFFDADYSLSKLSTVEFIKDLRFACTGLAWKILDGFPGCFAEGGNNNYYIGWYLKRLVEKYGPRLECLTLVVQNGKFDCLILQEHFGITPQYVVDTIDLDKMWDARAKHSLKEMIPRWQAPTPKGDTMRFKGLHWEDMTEAQRMDLRAYNLDDVDMTDCCLRR